MIGRTIADLAAGDHAELTRRVEPADVAAFVRAVGDRNPVHSDAAYAASTSFKVPIAPGIYTAGLVSAVIGTVLPGPGAIYLSQSLTFLKPVRIGDTITARAQVVEILRDRNRVRLRTVCVDERAEEVLVGEAWVMPSKVPVVYEAARPPAPAWTPWTWPVQAMALWGALSLSLMAGLAGAGAAQRSKAVSRTS